MKKLLLLLAFYFVVNPIWATQTPRLIVAHRLSLINYCPIPMVISLATDDEWQEWPYLDSMDLPWDLEYIEPGRRLTTYLPWWKYHILWNPVDAAPQVPIAVLLDGDVNVRLLCSLPELTF